MRTVLVTGGAGFIGSHLVDQLLDDGAAVRVLDNLSTGSLGNLHGAAGSRPRRGGRLEVIIGDVRDREMLRKAVRNVKHVFHLAALPSGAVPAPTRGDVHAVNVEGTLNVLQAALTEGVWRVVLGSCASVYGVSALVPLGEEAPLRPTSLFGASKVAAETYCRAFHVRHQLDTVVLRYFTAYGPRQRSLYGTALIPELVDAMRYRRGVVDVDERSAGDFMYISDVVAATLAAARAPRAGGQVINVASGEMLSVGDVLGVLTNLLQAPSISCVPRDPTAPVYRICGQTTLATELLDFTPRVSMVSGLAQVIQSVIETEQPVRSALAPVGFDD